MLNIMYMNSIYTGMLMHHLLFLLSIHIHTQNQCHYTACTQKHEMEFYTLPCDGSAQIKCKLFRMTQWTVLCAFDLQKYLDYIIKNCFGREPRIRLPLTVHTYENDTEFMYREVHEKCRANVPLLNNVG